MKKTLQETENQRHMRKTLGLCRFLGLNSSRWSEFKLAYDMVVINELGV